MTRPCFLFATLALLVAVSATGSAQVSPAPRATVEKTVYLSDCAGTDVFAQGEANTAESSYLWQQIENGKVITLPYTARNYPYTIRNQADTLVCEVVSTTVNARNNLMASGDFEVCPPDFESDYQYAFEWRNDAVGCGFNQGNFYDNCPDKYKSNIYAITANATTFWRDYLVTQPHGGNYFALFDAGKEGYAWKAETKKGNPNLKVQKDSTYLFSYWAAHPNGAKYSNSPAELQFVLILRNGTQKADTVDLGAPHKLYQAPEKDNNWHKVEVQWTNTLRDCDDVVIGVYDRNRDSGVGNDFCLDDIMFQNTTYISTEVLYRTTFIITPKPGAECCPQVLQGNAADTTVCLQDLPVVWHKTVYGETFAVHFDGVDASGNSTVDTVVRYKVQHPGCDSIRFQFRLHAQDCHTCPTTIQAPAEDTVVCYDTPFPLKWRGHTFATRCTRYEHSENHHRFAHRPHLRQYRLYLSCAEDCQTNGGLGVGRRMRERVALCMALHARSTYQRNGYLPIHRNRGARLRLDTTHTVSASKSGGGTIQEMGRCGLYPRLGRAVHRLPMVPRCATYLGRNGAVLPRPRRTERAISLRNADPSGYDGAVLPRGLWRYSPFGR